MKKIILIILPLFLLGAGIISALLFNTISLTSLSYVHKGYIQDYSGNSRVKGQKITGEFIGNEQNLGIIKVTLGKFTHVAIHGENYIAFRIKEKGEKQWYHQNKYYIGNDRNTFNLLIGFPPISNSKGNQYYFEIAPLHEKEGNYFEISGRAPTFKTIYNLDKKDIVASPFTFVGFTMKKSFLYFKDTDFIFSSMIYLAPSIVYLFGIFGILYRKKILKLYAFLIVILMLSDVLFIFYEYAGLVLVLIALWVLVATLNRLESSVSFLIAFIFICIYVALRLSGNLVGLDTLSTYIYGFLVTGMVFAVCEYKWKQKNK